VNPKPRNLSLQQSKEFNVATPNTRPSYLHTGTLEHYATHGKIIRENNNDEASVWISLFIFFSVIYC
jgi:hypothetical protein